MAKADGTYYEPDEAGIAARTDDGHIFRLDLFAYLTGGSGTARVYVEAQKPDGSWVDITEAYAMRGWLGATAGNTADYHVIDELMVASAYDYVRAKIVLDTAGADDADYDVTWRRVDLR